MLTSKQVIFYYTTLVNKTYIKNKGFNDNTAFCKLQILSFYTLEIFLSFSLWGAFNVVCFNVIVFFLIMAHMRAVFSDPGMVPFPDNNLDFSDMHSGAGSPINKVGNFEPLEN